MALLSLLVAGASASRFFVPAVQPAAPQQAVQTPAQAGFLQPYEYVELATVGAPVAAESPRSVFGGIAYMAAGAGVAVLGVLGFAKAKSVLAARSATPEMSGAIPTTKKWITFVSAAECPPGQVASGFRYGQEIAIANDKGSLYAIANKLPPTGQPATFGELQGKGILKEPITGTNFNMKTGKPVGEWCPTLVGKLFRLLVAPQDVATYPVRKSGNNIEVQINVNAKAQFEASYWRGVLDSQGKVDGGYY
jgi:nitrite reductase/ring-hydroxylating ferredoxin subunit